MITETKNQLILTDEDFNELMHYIKNHEKQLMGQAGMAEWIGAIKHANILPAGDFPWDTIRLYSKVIIRDKMARVNYTYTLVLPAQSDHRKCRVSVFSSIGKALLGFKRGEDISWETTGKKRYFTVMAVSQLHAEKLE